MSAKAKYARIAITLPEPDLAAADRLAVQHDRSRSWIIAEAVRHYVTLQTAAETARRLGPSRAEQLRRDMAMTASERVRDADVVAVESDVTSQAIEQPRMFATFEDFAAWRRSSAKP